MCIAKTSFDGLEEVASKKEEWATLPISEKVELLKEIVSIINKKGYDDFKAMGEEASKMMGIPVETFEGQMEVSGQALLFITQIKGELEAFVELFTLRSKGMEKAPKKMLNLKMRKAANGQICISTFPLFAKDSTTIASICTGEAWMNADAVKDESDVRPYSFDKFEARSGGVTVILGAGNQGFLSVSDVIHSLFIKNCVVYLKHHPLRAYLDPVVRSIFAPLIERKYMDTEFHSTVERSEKLVHHPLVTAVHLTGGKGAHDAIVWGSDPKERAINMKNNTPKLKATMTSELGAVSPWIVVPGEYSEKELVTQAKMLAFFIHSNASCNCNSPKMVCISDSWKQKEAFLNILDGELRKNCLPVAYYPGVEGRWQTFREKYPEATEIHSTSGLGIEERQLKASLGAPKPLLLPFLKIEKRVNLSTDAGRKAANDEYAFNNEPFAPVYTIANLENTESLDSFCTTVAKFCNDYLFGSLSGSISVAPAAESKPEFEMMIGSLQYGALSINTWAGLCYCPPGGGWGAFPGESLDDVESGIGQVHNMLFLPHFEKFVMRAPLVSMAHGELLTPKRQVLQAKIMAAVSKFALSPGVTSVVGIFSAVAGVDLIKVTAACSVAALAAAVAFYK